MEEKLNIVDENDEIIGEEARGKIHKEGLLHRETHVWFLTPNKELILQLRAKDKDTFPDMLDATVGGHVDLGMNYEDTALKEMEEETGIKAKMEDLKFLRKIRLKSDDLVSGKINNTFKKQFVYIYNGNLADLKIEEGKSQGFEVWPLGRLQNLTEEEKSHFVPGIVEPELLDLLAKI